MSKIKLNMRYGASLGAVTLVLLMFSGVSLAVCGYTTITERCSSPDVDCPEGAISGPGECTDMIHFYLIAKCPAKCTPGLGNTCVRQPESLCYTIWDCQYSELLDKCKLINPGVDVPADPWMNTGSECAVI